MRVFLGRPQLSRGRNARRWAVRDRARLARVRAEGMPGGRTNATKVIGAPYRRPEASAGGGPTCKASANEWLARVTVALHGHLRDAGREPAASPWALVLDTERCDTILALDEAGAIPKRRCVVPNPDAAVCRAARTHGAHAVEATSHAVLVPDGPVHPLLRAAVERIGAAAATGAPGGDRGVLDRTGPGLWTDLIHEHVAQEVEAGRLEKCVTLAEGYRSFLMYHVQATKSQVHTRIRRRSSSWLQVLNRARPEALKVEKKTIKGRTFNRN